MSAGAPFAFSVENDARARTIVGRYPDGRQASAVIPLLSLAQEQCGGWLPQPALDFVAEYLGMAPIRVYEVASFYDMFNTRPVGRIQVRVCTTTPCWLCGSDEVVRACRDTLGIGIGESTPDGAFYLREFECLGACANAPMMWVDDHYYEDLDYDRTRAIIAALQRGEAPRPGPQGERRTSMPAGGKTTLLQDPHVQAEPERDDRPGKPDEEPVDKARPPKRVRGQAEKVEREGRPADQEGERVAGTPEDAPLVEGRKKRAPLTPVDEVVGRGGPPEAPIEEVVGEQPPGNRKRGRDAER